MRESLRLGPPAPGRSVCALEDTTLLNGKYAIPKDIEIRCNIFTIHRDRSVWGEDVSLLCCAFITVFLINKTSNPSQADEFRPERMLDGKFDQLPVRFLFIHDIRCTTHLVLSAWCMAAVWIWASRMHRRSQFARERFSSFNFLPNTGSPFRMAGGSNRHRHDPTAI